MSDAAGMHRKAIDLGKLVLRQTTMAGSGHPSTGLALAHIVVDLMYERMRYDPANPWHAGADRLVLSAGHAVPIVYAAYADLGGVVGVDRASARPLTVADLDTLRDQESVLDGHPNPAEGFPFFDAATGSLGQGLSVAAGLALAARMDGNDKRIYCILGDGEAREGQVWEAADLIVDEKLTNVCAIVSCNGHGQAGPVSNQQSAERLGEKFRAFGWMVQDVDGHDPVALSKALDAFSELSPAQPVAIMARTVKGWGVDLMLGKNFHGKPVPGDQLDEACAQLEATAAKLGAADATYSGPASPPMPTGSPDCARAGLGGGGCHRDGEGGGHGQGHGNGHGGARRKCCKAVLPPIAEGLETQGLGKALKDKKLATRVAYGAAVALLGERSRRVVALDGDVSNSTFANAFAKAAPDRFVECKIAEQNMVTVAAGMAAAGKIAFASSFGKFLARACDQVDMAVISRANIKLVGSHCGVSLAADGPSQMAVADVAYYRSMTRVSDGLGGRAMHVFQPSDAVSAYRCVELMAQIQGLCYLRTFRPAVPFLYDLDEEFTLSGWKQLREGSHLTIVSSGYMVHPVLAAAEELAASGISCAVIDAFALPLEAEGILAAAHQIGGAILVVEDNYAGGLHAELAEAAAAAGSVQVVGMTANRIPKSARKPEEVFDFVGVGSKHIIAQAKALAQT
jgi:transketolase